MFFYKARWWLIASLLLWNTAFIHSLSLDALLIFPSLSCFITGLSCMTQENRILSFKTALLLMIYSWSLCVTNTFWVAYTLSNHATPYSPLLAWVLVSFSLTLFVYTGTWVAWCFFFTLKKKVCPPL